MKSGSIRLLGIVWIAGLLVAGSKAEGLSAPGSPESQIPTSMPTAASTYDLLAIPTLPENPSQEEFGKYIYYYNCMPCHGDQGQGLTDRWRNVWEEDHRNCWGRGCHGGRRQDEGFPIPTIVPAIILEGEALSRFSTPGDLLAYLKATHPPQKPGSLADQDYQALVAFLWAANGKPAMQATGTPAPTLQPENEDKKAQSLPSCGSAGMLIIGLLGATAMGYQLKDRRGK